MDLRVLHFTTTAGDSDYFRALAEYSGVAGVECVIGTLHAEGPLHETVRGFGLQAFGMGLPRGWGYGHAIARLSAYLRRERFPVVHTHLYDGCLVGLSAATVARTRLRVLTAHHVVDSTLHRDARGKRRAFAADAAVARWLCDCAVSPSSQTTEVLHQRYGVARRRIVSIPYGFRQLAPVRPSARTRVRAALGVGNGPVFTAVGRLHWVKDLPTLFRAFAAVRVRAASATLLIVGTGEERENLERLSRELGIEGSVVWTGHRSDVPDLLDASDIFVNCSLGEAFNQALMEALASGLFVVASDVGAASELVTSPDIGVVVPAGDSDALAAGMSTALERFDSGREERRRVAARYPIESMVMAYAELYRRELDRNRVPRNG